MSDIDPHATTGTFTSVPGADEFDEEPLQYSPRSRLGALPWWVVSTTVHAILLFLAWLIVIRNYEEKKDRLDLSNIQFIEPKEEPREKPEKVELEKKNPLNIQVEAEQTFFTPEQVEVSHEVETENEVEAEFKARGHQDAVSTIPAEGQGSIGFYGVGSGGRSGAFGWRTGGGRKRLAAAHGGSPATESAVDLGLQWLFHHQEPEGFWDRLKYGGGGKEGNPDNVGMTGLATLAFLGAGYTEKHGKYKDTVKRAIEWLISQQNAQGRFDNDGAKSHGYRTPMAAMALSEAAGMAKVPSTVEAAQKAIDGVVDAQGPYEAWNYRPKTQPGRNDSSVTIWDAMALKSAKVAGLRVPGTAFTGVLNWVDHAQRLDNAVPGDYEFKGGMLAYSGKIKDKGSLKFHETSSLLLAAGGVIRLFWGQPLNHPGVVGPCNLLVENSLPGARTEKYGDSYYGWYYATLLMFQKGGDHWEKWNKAMQSHYLARQIQGDPRDMGGSWDPKGKFVNEGGRVFSTSLCVLSLEVYYRYLPMYGK